MSNNQKILLIWGGMISFMLAGSLLPNFGPPQKYQVDKLLHLAAYGALMFFPAFYLRGRTRTMLIAIALIVLGLGIEFIQNYMPNRKGSYGDMLFNFLGVFGGLIFGRMFRRRARKARKMRDKELQR